MLLALTLLVPSCKAPRAAKTPEAGMRGHDAGSDSPGRLAPGQLPPREKGPPRPETVEQVAAAADEGRRLVSALTQSGVPAREVASVADMRGYRLYRRRYFGQALAWFRSAIAVDSTFELSLYNAARCTALLGHSGEAAEMLGQLRRLGTPLSRARLELATSDPDLAAVRRGAGIP